MNNETQELSFDQLAELAVEDPKAFEEYRTTQIEMTISSASAKNQRRLRGVQFQIDAQRSMKGNATGSCVKVYQMMQDSLSNLNNLLQDFSNGTSTIEQYEAMPAKVLNFSR